MALDLGELFIRLGARTQGLRRGEREARKFARNTERHFNRTNSAAKRLGATLAGIISIEGARRAVLLADKYKALQIRIQTATRATGDYVQVSKQLFDISNRTGGALETNVKLFQGLARVAPELNATNEQILTLTEALGQLGQIGGSGNAAMRAGLLQLTQGLAAGVLPR